MTPALHDDSDPDYIALKETPGGEEDDVWRDGSAAGNTPALEHSVLTVHRFTKALRQRLRLLVLVAIGTVLVALLLSLTLLSEDPAISKQKLLSFLHGSDNASGDDADDALYYHWHTLSAFDPVRIDTVPEPSVQDLCAAFPTHLLNDVQPVLKTGHGVLESRVRPQLQTGLACLDTLLLFSDITETFAGRALEDVIAATPQHLIDSSKQLEPYRRLRQCIADRQGEGTDCGDVIAPKEGWKIDKFKFLPAVLRAWRLRPERKWYLFLEADTYVVWDAVFRLLGHFDADKAWYFGSPSPGRNGTWFAYGGTGFIVSREAMRRLVDGDGPAKGHDAGAGLIEGEWKELLHDCCGDSILGWTLYKRGVELAGLWPLFNPHPPTSIPFSRRYWCQPVLSMHKPSVGELEALWRWEWRERSAERPLLYRDLALSFFDAVNLQRKQGWDNAAWDELGFDGPPGGETVETVDVETADECATACNEDPECFSWTHHLGTCKLVHSIRIGKARFLDPDGEEDGPRDESFVAGWATQRIGAWSEENDCKDVEWVKPSIERHF